MPRFAKAALALIFPLVVACGWWNSGGGSMVKTQVGQVSSCILDEVLQKGITDPMAIVAACAGATVGDVAADVESLIAYYTTPVATDAGGAALALPEAPRGLVDRLRAVDAACRALLADAGAP